MVLLGWGLVGGKKKKGELRKTNFFKKLQRFALHPNLLYLGGGVEGKEKKSLGFVRHDFSKRYDVSRSFPIFFTLGGGGVEGKEKIGWAL
jgi:hypothetical protein